MASRESFQTYKGIAVYPWITKPDTEYDSAGVFKTGLKVPADQFQTLKEKIEQVAVDEFGAKKAKTAKMPYKQDEETGEIIINAKSKYQPKVYDTQGGYVDPAQMPNIWGGSVLRLKGIINPYDRNGNTGISLLLDKVQIVELSEGMRQDDGFEPIEGGYVKGNIDATQTEEEAFDANF